MSAATLESSETVSIKENDPMETNATDEMVVVKIVEGQVEGEQQEQEKEKEKEGGGKQWSCCTCCLEFYSLMREDKRPRLLACNHTYCHNCCIQMLRAEGIQCPLGCSKKTKSLTDEDLGRNYEVEKILAGAQIPEEKVPQCGNCEKSSTLFCGQCQDSHLCNQCSKQIHSLKMYADHRPVVLSLKEQIAGRLCTKPDHREVIKFWCEDCSEVICRDCKDMEHFKHSVIFANKAVGPVRLINEECITRLQKEAREIAKQGATVLQVTAHIGAVEQEWRTKLENVINHAKSLIEQRSTELLTQFKKTIGITVEELYQQEINIGKCTSQLHELQHNVQNAMAFDPISMLVRQPELKTEYKTVLENCQNIHTNFKEQIVYDIDVELGMLAQFLSMWGGKVKPAQKILSPLTETKADSTSSTSFASAFLTDNGLEELKDIRTIEALYNIYMKCKKENVILKAEKETLETNIILHQTAHNTAEAALAVANLAISNLQQDIKYCTSSNSS